MWNRNKNILTCLLRGYYAYMCCFSGVGVSTDRPLQIERKPSAKRMAEIKEDEADEFSDSIARSKKSSKAMSKMAFLKLHGDRFLFFKSYVKIGTVPYFTPNGKAVVFSNPAGSV